MIKKVPMIVALINTHNSQQTHRDPNINPITGETITIQSKGDKDVGNGVEVVDVGEEVRVETTTMGDTGKMGSRVE